MNVKNQNKEWINRQEATDESRRDYEYERLAAWALNEIHEAMERNNLTKADLARALGTSRANITQAFSGSRNITLRTLSDLAWACISRVSVKVEPLRTGEFISCPVLVVDPVQRVVKVEDSGQGFPCNELELVCGCSS
jgi:hypothetical protein